MWSSSEAVLAGLATTAVTVGTEGDGATCPLLKRATVRSAAAIALFGRHDNDDRQLR